MVRSFCVPARRITVCVGSSWVLVVEKMDGWTDDSNNNGWLIVRRTDLLIFSSSFSNQTL